MKNIKNLGAYTNNNLKFKTFGKTNSGGRNNSGKITAFRKGGGHKKSYRKIDFKRINLNGIITSIEYDPNRTCNIASVYDKTSKKFKYILAPKGLKFGDLIKSGSSAEINLGHTLPLKKIPLGSFIHNISLTINGIGKFARSAGAYAQLIHKNEQYATVKLKSGEHRLIDLNCLATLGILSNDIHNNILIKKAGRSRWLNRRPTVRGVAMNPIDHPHGGGEGKTSGGRPSVTPWGKPAKGQPTTRSSKKLVTINRKNKNK